MQWDKRLEVGVAVIDGQHMHLVGMLADMGCALESDGAGGPAAVDVLQRLKLYAAYHFETEEKLMERHDYPETSAHRAEHRSFVLRLEEMEQDAAGDPERLAEMLHGFLEQWLPAHIGRVDRRLGAFLAERGEY